MFFLLKPSERGPHHPPLPGGLIHVNVALRLRTLFRKYDLASFSYSHHRDVYVIVCTHLPWERLPTPRSLSAEAAFNFCDQSYPTR
jgi:hypothetical protein